MKNATLTNRELQICDALHTRMRADWDNPAYDAETLANLQSETAIFGSVRTDPKAAAFAAEIIRNNDNDYQWLLDGTDGTGPRGFYNETEWLPHWNVMHECADMIGDTDGLGVEERELAEMDAQEHADFVRLAVTNPLLICKWCNQSFETYVTEGGLARLSCPHCNAGLGS